jgi:hypothetical protein
MPDVTHRGSRSALWVGLLITVLGALSNGLYFLNPPAQSVVPWINLIVPPIGLIIVGIGLRRAYVQPQVYRGKILGPAFAILCAVLAGGSIWGFFHARDIPTASNAPQAGQKAPDFTLANAAGRPMSLSALLSKSADDTNAPKAVLLVFYRGYW